MFLKQINVICILPLEIMSTQFYQLFEPFSTCLNTVSESATHHCTAHKMNSQTALQLMAVSTITSMQALYFHGVLSFIVKNSCMLQTIRIYMAWHMHHSYAYIQTVQPCKLNSSTHSPIHSTGSSLLDYQINSHEVNPPLDQPS